MSDSDDVIVRVDGLSKKFCRELRRSLIYGAQDVAAEAFGLFERSGGRLRAGEFWAVRDVGFEVRRGECVGLMGPNGAGKTTLLKMLNGLIKPDTGRITVRGRVGALIALGAGFSPVLSGRENVYINGAVLGFTRAEIEAKFDEIVEFASIGDFLDSPVRSYSSGMSARLGFAVAAHLDPDLLLVDEILAVGDVRFRMKCYDHMLKLRNGGCAIIIVSHSTNQLPRVATRALCMARGELRLDGRLEEGIAFTERTQLASDASATQEGEGAVLVGAVVEGSADGGFQTYDDIVIEVRVRVRRAVRSCRMTIGVEAASVGPISSVAIRPDLPSPIEAGCECVFRITLQRLPLKVGHYLISAHLFGEEKTDLMLSARRCASFDVTGPPTALYGEGTAGVVELAAVGEVEVP